MTTAPAGDARRPSSGLTWPLWRTAKLVRRHIERHVLAHEPLTWTEYAVLQVVCAHHETKTLDVATEVGIAKGTLTAAVASLERQGLVRRETPTADLRQVLLRPTTAGLALATRLTAAAARAQRQLFATSHGAAALADLVRWINELDTPGTAPTGPRQRPVHPG